MTPEQFRREALGLSDAVEGEHHAHPDFRAHGRIFASLHPDGERAMVKVPPAVQAALLAAYAGAAEPASGAWGRAGCTMLRLSAFRVADVRDALREAWQFAAGARGAKARKPSRPRPRRS